MATNQDAQIFRYQTRVALPLLDIPEAAWLHCSPRNAPEPGDVIFGRVNGTVSVGTVDLSDDGLLLFRDGSSGEVIPIRRAEDLRAFGKVVGVTHDFA